MRSSCHDGQGFSSGAKSPGQPICLIPKMQRLGRKPYLAGADSVTEGGTAVCGLPYPVLWEKAQHLPVMMRRRRVHPDCSSRTSCAVAAGLPAPEGGRILSARRGSKGEGRRRKGTRKGGQEMPVFENQCRICGRSFEVFTQRPDPAAKPRCPGCGKSDVERVLSTFSGRIAEGGGCKTSPHGFG